MNNSKTTRVSGIQGKNSTQGFATGSRLSNGKSGAALNSSSKQKKRQSDVNQPQSSPNS